VIEPEVVRHVARLARLRLDSAELARMERELNGILGHVERIQALDLEGVPPTTHVVPLSNVTREDVPRPSLPLEEALREAPEVVQGGFAVRSFE
jgi:aspartyl-tRNA(Asn)/glutamyl-tRNA(Gln) amidotransferase subunit C